jgi:hypothetical protein
MLDSALAQAMVIYMGAIGERRVRSHPPFLILIGYLAEGAGGSTGKTRHLVGRLRSTQQTSKLLGRKFGAHCRLADFDRVGFLDFGEGGANANSGGGGESLGGTIAEKPADKLPFAELNGQPITPSGKSQSAFFVESLGAGSAAQSRQDGHEIGFLQTKGECLRCACGGIHDAQSVWVEG